MGEPLRLALRDVSSAEIFEAVLEYVYCGQVSVAIALLPELVRAAARLIIVPLLREAAAAVQERITAANCLERWALADECALPELGAAARGAAARIFKGLLESGQFHALPVERAAALLGDETLEVLVEEEVYEAAAAWVKAQEPAVSSEAAAAVFGAVRLPLLRGEFVAQRVMGEPLLDSKPGRELIATSFLQQHYNFGGEGAVRPRAAQRSSAAC